MLRNLEDENGINNLGHCYQYGIGTNINYQKTFELYQKAASLENANGINNLGHCYQYGIGTNIDNQKAFELYQKAGSLDHAKGIKNLDIVMKMELGLILIIKRH